MTQDDPADDSELAEARMLAEALERRDAAARDEVASRSIDPLDAADLIVASRAAQLHEARSVAVLERVHARIDVQARGRRWRALTWGFATTFALASVWLVIVQPQRETAPAPPPVDGLPAARAALESAQRAWLSERTDGAARALDGRLHDYRAAYLASLDGRYAR